MKNVFGLLRERRRTLLFRRPLDEAQWPRKRWILAHLTTEGDEG